MSGYLALRIMEGQGSTDINSLNNNQLRVGEDGAPVAINGSVLPREELLLAVKSNDEPRLRHALQHTNHSDLDYIFPHPDSCAVLHIAAQSGSEKVVQFLLEAGADPNLRDHRGKKYTALHYASQIWNCEVIRVLLAKGADVNVKEGEFGRTCLHILAAKWKISNEENLRLVLGELLKHKKIKIDRQDNTGATPLFLAAQKSSQYMVETLILKGASVETTVGVKQTKEIIEQKLPGLLESIDFAKVQKIKRDYGDDLYESMRDQNIDLFKDIIAEINDKEKDSKRLILEEDHGEYTLLNYACDHSLVEFVEVLLQEEADATHADKTSLLCPILYAAKNGNHKIMVALTNYMDKMGILKNGLKMSDRKLETALHKVVKREQPFDKDVDYLKCLQILLSNKGYINIDAQDDFNNTPLHYAVLCNDQSFVRHLLINGANLGIKNAFGTLAVTRIQPSVLEMVLNECIKFKNNVTDRDFEIILHYSMLAPATYDPRPETDCLKFLSESKPHRHLLRHPIIDTFLFLKWQRIRHYYFINLFAYAAFLFFLTTYIIVFYGSVPKNLVAPSGNVSESFIPPLTGDNNSSMSKMAIKILLQVFISVLWICVFLRESVQFVVSWKTYVRSLENWLEISILLMTLFLLFIPIPYSSQQSISAWLILTSWVELVLILGRHPLFAVYITMFTTVSYNFLKFIIMFSFVIIAFSLSFFLEFQVNENYYPYAKSLLKTIAMSTGELEYTELPLQSFPISSHLLFVIFVFLIVLVLMNLLNGLAVSDIQLIQKEAEIVSYRSRVELISYIESVFLADPYYEQQRQKSSERLCSSQNCCFRFCFTSTNPLMKFLNYLGRRTLMFRQCLKDHQITVFPNRARDRWHVCNCHSFHLDENQIEAAKSVVLSEEAKVSDRLACLESRIDTMMQAVNSLTNLVKKREINVASLGNTQ